MNFCCATASTICCLTVAGAVLALPFTAIEKLGDRRASMDGGVADVSAKRVANRAGGGAGSNDIVELTCAEQELKNYLSYSIGFNWYSSS